MGKKKGLFGEIALVTVISFFIVLGTTYILGTLTSGWHFVDDHEFLEYTYLMKYKNVSWWEMIKIVFVNDRTTRNNSLYYPSKVLLLLLCGPDPVKLSISKAVETAVSMILLYFCGKKITDSKSISWAFALTSLVGYQGATWWKLGPEQMQGTLCFGIAFLCLLNWLEKPGKKGYGIAAFIFSVAMGYYHESFFLVMPFMAFYCLYYAYKEDPSLFVYAGCKSVSDYLKKLCGGLKGRAVFAILCLVSCAIILIGIMLRLGTSSYDPVSFTSATPLSIYVQGTIYSIENDLRWYWKFGIILVGILLTYFDKLKTKLPDMAIAVIFMLPQIVLYSKEGIAERYLLPIIIGYSLFFVAFALKYDFLTGKRRKLYIFVLAMMLLVNGRGLVVEGDYYRFRGQGVTNALEQIEEMSDKGYTVMSCLGICNPEADWTVETYMHSKGKEDVLYWSNDDQKVYTVRPFLNSPKAEERNLEDVDVVVAYNRNDRHFEVEPNFDLSDFTLVRTAGIDIYYRNEASKEVTDELIQRLHVKPTLHGIGE
ncbi:glycosyltransferase family 39 protein [Butyrivibrio sp. MC2021]|uniref:glycosyltransferase family 39 protein n=1 Tax=Butyrivibrio sp. MC2021 TaxID=1408306 RepID=UPI00047CBE89|nr:glycosyltransferase family 39 protein [Butyrivibrio sp. MC2021]